MWLINNPVFLLLLLFSWVYNPVIHVTAAVYIVQWITLFTGHELLPNIPNNPQIEFVLLFIFDIKHSFMCMFNFDNVYNFI